MNPSTRDVSRTEACGYSVRLDWPDGTHTFSRFAAARGRAERLAQKDIEFWSRSPYKPLEYRIVEISRHDWLLHGDHRPNCRAPDCPN